MASLISLATVENQILVKDMNYLFHYERIKNPDNVLTKYFNLFYKEEKQNVWSVCATGLLSDEFTIVKTEDAINDIKTSLKAEILTQKNYRNKTIVRSKFTLTGFELDIEKETAADKIIFQLLSNVNMDSVDSSTVLSFNITNGFAGNMSLMLDYGFMTCYNNDPTMIINNPYILGQFSTELIHDGKMDIKYHDVQNVKNKCSELVKDFKSISLTKDLISQLQLIIPKKKFNSLMSCYEQLPDIYKNLYYFTYLVSAMFDDSKSFKIEISIRQCLVLYYEQVKKLNKGI